MISDYIRDSFKNIKRNKKNMLFIVILILLFSLLFVDTIFMRNYYGYLNYNDLMDIDFRTFSMARPVRENENTYDDIKYLKHVREVYESKYKKVYVNSNLDFTGLDGGIELLYGTEEIVPKSIMGKSIDNLSSGEMICPYDFYPDPDAFYDDIDEEKIIKSDQILNYEFDIYYTIYDKEVVDNKVVDKEEELTKKFKVVGLYDNKLLMKHNNQCYISPYDMKELVDSIDSSSSLIDGTFQDLQIVVDKKKNVTSVMNKLRSLGYQVSDDVNSYFDKDDIFILNLLSISFFVISLGAVFLILVNYINKKVKSNLEYLGILRSCGYTKKQILFKENVELVIMLSISFVLSLLISLIMYFVLISIFQEKILNFISFTYFNISYDFFLLILLFVIVLGISIIYNFTKVKANVNECIIDMLRGD